MLRNKYQAKREEGFTIIEVLIVLAIAGLIMLIVFLAVPALQRNSRNTQRKNDASSVIGAIQENINNNNGKLPDALTDFSGNYKLGYYNNAGDVTYTKNTGAVTTMPTDVSKLKIDTFAKCDGNKFTTAGSSVTSRNVAAIYFIETGNGAPTPQCVDM